MWHVCAKKVVPVSTQLGSSSSLDRVALHGTSFRRSICQVALSLVLHSLFLTPLAAQNVTGDLTGRVVNAEGKPLSDVRVTVAGSNLQGQRQGLTDRAGFFRILDLPTGIYTAEMSRVGFRPVVYEEVRIILGRVTTVGDIELEVEAVELSPLRVVAGAPAIDPVSTTIGSGLAASHFEQLPISRRDYQSIVNILPHANESYFGDEVAIGGSTGLENTYFIDGANVTDPFYGARGTRLPWNFIQSVQIRNGGYEAEYGRALGGIVDAVTHSGSNQFEASAFGFFSGSALADEPRQGLNDLRADAFHSFDVGLRLSGPFLRDRLWYSLAYNPRVESIDREIPAYGVSEDRQTIHAFATKINWHPHPNTDVDLSVFGDPSTRDAIAAPVTFVSPGILEDPAPFLSIQESGGTTATLALRQRIGPQVIVSADIARYSATSRLRPDNDSGEVVPLFIDLTTNTWSGGTGKLEEAESRRTAASASVSALLGPHAAKFGVEYEDNRIEYVFELDQIFRDDSAAYRQIVGSTAGPHTNRIPAVYLQDSWQITPRLAANAGIRWSRQQLVGDNGAGVQTFRGEWQPRLGAVFQLGRPGTQRLFASYGRFYQQLPVSFSTGFFAPQTFAIKFFSEDPRQPGSSPDGVLDLSTDPADFEDVDGIRAEHFDEFTGGYERALGKDFVIGARLIHRVLRAAFGYGIDLSRDNPWVIGNLGEGELDFLPEPKRNYSALEFTLRRARNHRLQGLVSYVLSRTHGNYSGLFDSDNGVNAPNTNASLRLEEQGPNSTGLLPNDRTHVFKLSGSYRFPFGLTAGTFFTVQSGTPLNEFGTPVAPCPPCHVYLVPRGSAGRSPTLWDLNFNFAYAVPFARRTSGRIFLDVLHVGSPRRSTWTDETLFLGQDGDGNQINPNPNFGQSRAFQPPMAARIGFEMNFGSTGVGSEPTN